MDSKVESNPVLGQPVGYQQHHAARRPSQADRRSSALGGSQHLKKDDEFSDAITGHVVHHGHDRAELTEVNPIQPGPDVLEKDEYVVYRIVNKNSDTKMCQVAYVSMDPFEPDPEILGGTTLFRDYISYDDFVLLIDLVNAVMQRFRSRSKVAVFVLLAISFAALIVCIFAHLAAGVSIQFVSLVVHAGLQRHIKKKCVAAINRRLARDVNESLILSRRVYFKAQRGGDGCFSGWIECDLCQLPTLPADEMSSGASASPIRRNSSFSMKKSEKEAATAFDSASKNTTALALRNGNPLTPTPSPSPNRRRSHGGQNPEAPISKLKQPQSNNNNTQYSEEDPPLTTPSVTDESFSAPPERSPKEAEGHREDPIAGHGADEAPPPASSSRGPLQPIPQRPHVVQIAPPEAAAAAS